MGRTASTGPARAPTQRQLRVGEEIRHLLAQIFARGEFRDKLLAQARITVSEVRVGADLKHASVFITVLGGGEVAPLLPALARVVPYLRGQLARGLRLRGVPDLHFLADSSIDYAMHVDALLRAPEVQRDLSPRE